MFYQKHYDLLIAKARSYPPDGYCEIHHIVPRCMGGGNNQENLIALSARQHFVAHLLLAKIYGGKLVYAVHRMMTADTKNNRQYAWVKRKLSIEVSRQMAGNQHRLGHSPSQETRDKISEKGKGKIRSQQTRSNMSKAQKGLPSPFKGKIVGPRKKRKTPQARAHAAKVMKALWEKRRSEDFKQKPHSKPRSEEYRQRRVEIAKEMWARRKALL